MLADQVQAVVVSGAIECTDGDGITRWIAALRALQATVESGLIRAGVRAEILAAEGQSASARDALLGAGSVRGATARSEAKRAELAQRRPDLVPLMTSGRLGPDHLDALVRRLGRLDDEQLQRVDLTRFTDGPPLPADTFDVALRTAVDTALDEDDRAGEANDLRAQSEVRHWFNHRTGMGHLTAKLDPERYEALVTALDQHTTALAARAESTTSRNAALAAAALVDLVGHSGARQRHLPHITVVVDRRTLAEGIHPGTIAQTGDGHLLDDAAVARLGCDAILRRVTLSDDGVPIDVGRRHRTATDAQWAALRSVHSTCAWLGCDRPLSHCQAHHLRHWRHGGPTDLANLVPLCTHHHHLVHEGRWHIRLEPDRSLVITRPDGRRHGTTHPPSRRPPPALVVAA